MLNSRSLLDIACRTAAFSLLTVGLPTILHAQQSPSSKPAFDAPLFVTFGSTPANLALASSSTSSSSESSVASDPDSDARFTPSSPAALDRSQPPPRRYGRPNYSDKNSNPDGSRKYVFVGGLGLALPTGNTHHYQTPSYGFQVGAGRNFNQNVGILMQFDYDHFGLQGATIANQEFIFNYCTPAVIAAGRCPPPVTGLDGNNHVWSFTLNPTFTLATQGTLGAYAVVGAGFYHKVTNFTEPAVATTCEMFGCFSYQVAQNVGHYTSNAVGVNGGFGLTCKLSRFSNERLYVEARYVLVLDPQRRGFTAQNVATTTYAGFNAYPANSNRTTYIPIKFGIRF